MSIKLNLQNSFLYYDTNGTRMVNDKKFYKVAKIFIEKYRQEIQDYENTGIDLDNYNKLMRIQSSLKSDIDFLKNIHFKSDKFYFAYVTLNLCTLVASVFFGVKKIQKRAFSQAIELFFISLFTIHNLIPEKCNERALLEEQLYTLQTLLDSFQNEFFNPKNDPLILPNMSSKEITDATKYLKMAIFFEKSEKYIPLCSNLKKANYGLYIQILEDIAEDKKLQELDVNKFFYRINESFSYYKYHFVALPDLADLITKIYDNYTDYEYISEENHKKNEIMVELESNKKRLNTINWTESQRQLNTYLSPKKLYSKNMNCLLGSLSMNKLKKPERKKLIEKLEEYQKHKEFLKGILYAILRVETIQDKVKLSLVENFPDYVPEKHQERYSNLQDLR